MDRTGCCIRATNCWIGSLSCAVAWLIGVGCDDLPTITAGECGNRVVDEGEDCDDFPRERGLEPVGGAEPEFDACHPVGSPYECRWDCRARAVACPDGAGCGVDGVCRMASERTSPFVFQSGTYDAPLVNGDFDGDGRADLLVLDDSGTKLLSFDQQRTPGALSSTCPPDAPYAPLVAAGSVDGDTHDDVVAIGYTSLDLMRGTPLGLTPAPQLRNAPPATDRRLLSLDAHGDGTLYPWMISDRALLRVPLFGNEEFDTLGTIDAAAGEIAGKVSPIRFPAQGCSGFVLASRGAQAVQVYQTCDGSEASSLKSPSTVVLGPPHRVGSGGVHVGDVDGDGFDDLAIAAGASESPPAECDDYNQEVYVAYGLGDGRFQSQPPNLAGIVADGVAAKVPILIWGDLLSLADLDGNGSVDFITSAVIEFNPMSCEPCRCEFVFSNYWTAAAAADFTRDGNVDVIGVDDRGVRSLTLLLGTGRGFSEAFIEHSIGTPAPVALDQVSDERPPSLAVGDYDGDLTTDLAFTLLSDTGPSPRRTAAILYGKGLSIPSEIQSIGSVGDLDELVTIKTDPGGAADLFFRAKREDGDGVGMISVGQAPGPGNQGPRSVGSGAATRPLFSPLFFPNALPDPSGETYTEVAAAALGAFTGRPERLEAVALLAPWEGQARSAEGEPWLWLSFVENADAGFAIGDPSPFEVSAEQLESLRRGWFDGHEHPVIQALDIDADGSDELVLSDSKLAQSELAYWVIRRTAGAWSSQEQRVEVHGVAEAELDGEFYFDAMSAIDVDLDGRRDLVLQGYAKQTGSFVAIVMRNDGSGALSAGTAFALDGDVNAIAFSNVDHDPELELVSAGERGVEVYDADLSSGALEERPSLRMASGPVFALQVGDFDGDGVSDVAASGQVVTVFFRDPEAR